MRSTHTPHPLTPVIEIDSTKCVNCHACIDACPVKHCNDGSGDHIAINHDTCIGCGQCIDACKHGARKGIDDSARFFADVGHIPMVSIVAPAVAAVFPDQYLRFNGWLKSIGVKANFDVSFGAELTIKTYLDHVQKNNPKAVISQPCPALVSWIELYKPELLPYLAPADSPMLHTAKMVREFFPKYRDHRIVVISPCIAKRREFDETGIGDYNVTFNSIIEYMREHGQNIQSCDGVDYDNPPAERAVLFSTPGGLLETAKRWNPAADTFSRKIEGPHTVYHYLENLPESIRSGCNPLLIDCLNCEMGCNGGTGTPNREASQDELESAVRRRAQAMKARYQKEHWAGETREGMQKAVEKQVNRYWKPGLYGRTYVDRSANVTLKNPGESDVQDIYRRMLKRDKADELNCGGCGYGSCAEMAKAIHNGLNVPDNCHFYKRWHVEADAEELNKVGETAASLISSVSEVSSAITEVENNANDALAGAKSGSEVSKRVAESIHSLTVAGDAISKFSKTISEIAFKTQLLALNASIEAARAGESGAGFAVVAGEVKSLAKASDEAASQIAKQVGSITSSTKATNDLVIELRKTVDTIGESQASITAAVTEQATAVRTIGEKVTSIAHEAEERARKIAELFGGGK